MFHFAGIILHMMQYYKSKAMVFFFMPFTARLPVAVPSLPTWDQYKSRFVSFLPKMDTDYL